MDNITLLNYLKKEVESLKAKARQELNSAYNLKKLELLSELEAYANINILLDDTILKVLHKEI